MGRALRVDPRRGQTHLPTLWLQALAVRRGEGGNPSCCAGGLHPSLAAAERGTGKGNLLCVCQWQGMFSEEGSECIGAFLVLA